MGRRNTKEVAKKSPQTAGKSRYDPIRRAREEEAAWRVQRSNAADRAFNRPKGGDALTDYACGLIRKWATVDLIEIVPLLERFARPAV